MRLTVLVECADERQLEPFVYAADRTLTTWIGNDANQLRAFSFHHHHELVLRVVRQ